MQLKRKINSDHGEEALNDAESSHPLNTIDAIDAIDDCTWDNNLWRSQAILMVQYQFGC